MFSTRHRSLAAIAAGALLLAPLAGCGSDAEDKKAEAKSSASSTPSTPTADPSDEAESGENAGNYDDAVKEVKGTEIDPDVFLKDVVGSMRDEKSAHMVIDMGSSVTMDAQVAYGDKTAMKMTMTTGGQTLKAILIGGTVYVQQPPSKKYIKVDKSTPGSEAVLGQFQNLNPAETVDALKGAIVKVVKVGKKKVAGDQLTEYSLTVDTAKMTKQLGQAVAGADLPQRVTYTMFVDDDGLLRVAKMDVSGQKVTMRMTDWGKKVDIKAPAASEIIKQ